MFISSYSWLLTVVYICFGALLAVYFAAVVVSYRRRRGGGIAVRGGEYTGCVRHFRRKHGLIRHRHGIAHT